MMVKQEKVKTISGKEIPVAETICIHDDGKNAVEFAKAIKNLCSHKYAKEQ